MITVREIHSSADLKKFVKFPFSLYKDNPYWVPPIIKNELETLDKTKNPVFKNAEIKFYLAYKGADLVGRIALIINHIEIKELNKKKVRFGWFDFIDDERVSRALIEQAIEHAKETQMEYIEGPMGFSNLDKAGCLTDGFDQKNTMATWYHAPYYHEHLEKLGMVKEAEFVEYKLNVKDIEIPERVARLSDLILKKYNLKLLKFTNKKEIFPHVNRMFELFNETYKELQTFVPIQQYQIDHYKKKYIPFVDPDLMCCIMDENDKMLAFAIVMPFFGNALQKANGKLFPFGFFHMMKAFKQNDTACFYLIGVEPEMQQRGLTAIIFQEMLKTFRRRKIYYLESNPELKENLAIQALWKDYSKVMHKQRSTYKLTV